MKARALPVAAVRCTPQSLELGAHWVPWLWSGLALRDATRSRSIWIAAAHVGGILPPISDRNAAVTHDVNGAVKAWILCLAATHAPHCRFLFASLMSVYGANHGDELLGAATATSAPDLDTLRKRAAEAGVRVTPLAWTIVGI